MITQDRVNELFAYDRDGFLVRKINKANQRAGQKVGTVKGNGYVTVMVDYKFYQVHRLIWLLHHGTMPKNDIDHINGKKQDNRIENLREATRSENMQNEKRARVTSKSGMLGVHKNNGRWRAVIWLNYKKIHIGYFNSKEEAHQAYLVKKRELHPFQTIA